MYLNAANVGLMYSEAEKVIREWYKDLAYNGSNNFDENAEESVFKKLHIAAAALINAEPDDIAAGSSATELLCSLAWAVSPKKDQNVVSTETVFPSTIYPWQRVAKSTGCEIRLAKEKNNFINIDDIIALIDQNTAAVSISHVEYANGQLYNLELLADAVHTHNALLVVDASQGVEAQTLANVYQAVEANHEIVSVLNKVDLAAAEPIKTRQQIEEVIGIDASDAIETSAKTGQGIEEVLAALVERLPAPQGNVDAPLKALLVDSWYDSYLGVVVLVRIHDGILRKGQKVRFMSNGSARQVDRVGILLSLIHI